VTSSEWGSAFDKGSPEAIGQALHDAYDQAIQESLATHGDLATHTGGVWVRVGEILSDQGVIRVPGTEQKAPDLE
jgi:hypothetical protein